MIAAIGNVALGVFIAGCAWLFWIGCIATVDSRHLSSVSRARQARKGRRES